MPHEPGELLAGRYRLDDRIASGGMGDVWLATDTVLGRRVAVKTLRADRAVDPQFQTRFEHEARAMAALHHPGIVDVYDFGRETGEDAYLVMAHVDGQPLSQRIAEQGRLTLADTLAVVAQVGRALQAVHDAGIVHRDVKPANMIIRPDGTVVLVDFGVARSSSSAALTGARDVIGTANYIAPEQVSKKPVGPAADVYALGAVAYHCLSGHPPFFGDNPVAVAMQHVIEEPPPLPDDVPPRVRGLVATALAKDPAARYPSAAAMAAAADAAASATPAGAEAVTLAFTPMRTGAGHRTQVLAVVAALSVLLAAGTALAIADPFGWFPGTPQPATSEPAAPSGTPSPARSPRPDGGNGTGGSTRKPTSPPRTTSRTPSPENSTTNPTSGTPTTTSARPPTTTEPTREEPSDPPPASGS
ncbi:serine/threonine-protein kinase [Actinoplanes aureus]|uniref:non-specific serine/threonine protein kinase n=1 Tax=Actinoplanes aureus TaxID=2792083 RepID=A0A931C7J4_9ACTN|nr:serine/threonine-protein kinase [Actinoplanes aureus]MBG0561506.1 protein kinase [Actinoplanes aureus]